jgi:hypothetical protein
VQYHQHIASKINTNATKFVQCINFYLLHLLYEIGAIDHTYYIDINYYRIQPAIMTTYCIKFTKLMQQEPPIALDLRLMQGEAMR